MVERFLASNGGNVAVIQRVAHSCCDFLSQVSQKEMRDELLHDRYGKPAVIIVDRKGFIPQTINIMEGQILSFESTNPEDFPAKGYNIIQIVHDGHQFKVVPGGYQFVITGKRCRVEVQFSSEGEYKFGCGVLRCPPVTVRVQKRPVIELSVSDKGFQDETVYLYAGTTIKFTWSGCLMARRVYPSSFCYAHGGVCTIAPEKMPPSSKSGSFQFTIRTNGVYYFSTEDPKDVKGRGFICVVIAGDIPTERIVHILDTQIKPQVSFIQLNSNVQFRWSDAMPHACRLMHCAYQADIAPLDQNELDAKISQFRPAKDGFHWPETSVTGFLRHSPTDVGIVRFSDYNHLDQFSTFIGSVVVMPKPNDVAVIVDDKGFSPEVLQASLFDRVWFGWDIVKRRTKPIGIVFSKCDINFTDRYNYMALDNLEGAAGKLEQEHVRLELVVPSMCRGENCSKLDLRNLGVLTDSGLRNVRLPAVGVFYYVKRRRFPKDENRLKGLQPANKLVTSRNNYTYDEKDDEDIDEDAPLSTLSIVVNYASQDSIVTLTDSEFEPNVRTVFLSDRVWWVWKDISYPKNIVQSWPDGSLFMNEDNQLAGFSSGALVDPPNFFMHSFPRVGVYYYVCTDDLARIGTIEVTPQPRVVQVSLKNNEMEPKVITCSPRDVCCWLLRKLTTHMLLAVDARGDRIVEVTAELPEKNAVNAPVQVLDEPNATMLRRCFSRTFETPGVYHFSSHAFLNSNNPKEKLVDELVSTVIVDDVPDTDYSIVTIDADGQLLPNEINIKLGDTVMWIPAVVSEESEKLKVIIERFDEQGNLKKREATDEKKRKRLKAFNSTDDGGYPVFTFYHAGRYQVTYRSGTAKSYGIVCVEEDPKVAPTPIIHRNGRNLRFEVDDAGSSSAEIYYTLDGTVPLPGRVRTFVFNPEEEVMIPKGKYVIVRTRCFIPGFRYSAVANSERFWEPAHLVFADVLKPELGYIDVEMTLTCQVQPISGAVQLVINNVGRLDPDVDTLLFFINKKPYPKHFPSFVRNVFIYGLTQCRKYEFQAAFVRGSLSNCDVMSKSAILIYPPYTPSGTITLTASVAKPPKDAIAPDTINALFSWVPLGPAGMNYRYQFIFNGVPTDYVISDKQARKSIEMKQALLENEDEPNNASQAKKRNRCAVAVRGLEFDKMYSAYVVATCDDKEGKSQPIKSNIFYFLANKNEQSNQFFTGTEGRLQFADIDGARYHEFVQILSEWDYSVLVNGEEATRKREMALRKRAANVRRKPGLVGAAKTRSRVDQRNGQSRTRKAQGDSESGPRPSDLETAALAAATSTLAGD